MKVIFLDIDGVMNSISGSGPYLADMETSKLELLKRIIDENDVFGIVLISDRRSSNIYMKEFIDVLDKYEIFMVDTIRNIDDEDIEDNRGKQIKDYINNNKVDRFVILDDMDDDISSLFPNEYIQVNRFYGLNEEVASIIKSKLNF